MTKNFSNSGVRQMIRKQIAAAMTGILMVAASMQSVLAVQLVNPFGTGTQSQDPFSAKQKEVVDYPVADSTKTSASATPRLPQNAEQIMNAQIEQKLTSTMIDGNFSFPEIPFSEVQAFMKSKYQIAIVIDENAINDELDRDTIIDFSMFGISLERALELMVSKYNATFIVRAGTVQIISRDFEDDPEFFETRIFDCQELAKGLPVTLTEFVPARKKDDELTDPVNTLTTLERLVRENVHADSWKLTGTGDAVVREINGKLMVNSSGPALRETRRFLEYLKAELIISK